MSSLLLILTTLSTTVFGAQGDAPIKPLFLEDVLATTARLGPEVREAFRREMGAVLEDFELIADGSEELKLEQIEAVLRPLFEAMPKNEHGNFGHAAARYALHRFFSKQHGWFLKGLLNDGEGWNGTAAAGILRDGMPEHVMDLYENHVGQLGLSLRDLALLANTFERLVQQEATWRLEAAFRAHNLPMHAFLAEAQLDEAVDTYMASYILGLDCSQLDVPQMLQLVPRVQKSYKGWPRTVDFARKVRRETHQGVEELCFEDVLSVVVAIAEQYGRWQNTECQAIKGDLISLGSDVDQASGRIRLADFYNGALDKGKWHFGESVSYLRQLGALDETDPRDLRVLVPNYIHSPTNCIASSEYYSICCLDACEDLMGHLESELQQPDAPPDRIAEIIGGMASPSVPANRSLPAALLARLDEIAAHHEGTVPLHGRLFAQWMHHAYPQECPFPHISGTTRPLSAAEFKAETGLQPGASNDEMKQYVEAKRQRKRTKVAGSEATWHSEEELFVGRSAMPLEQSVRSAPAVGRCLAAVSLIVSSTVGVLRSVLPITDILHISPTACRKSHMV